ncbi:MAG: hypothetical protein CO080_02590 [Nitrospirae bacterium CG_4_9_14_0_8_um_filter_70_14]|nr:MAG: hypothetical protein CO080_02590 [Nitrospirae bacterium CG_4_9_14_0_8_um_filter_70_14]
MEHVSQAVTPRLTTCLFDLCAAVQASIGDDELDAGVDVSVIDRLLRRAWWAGKAAGRAEAA